MKEKIKQRLKEMEKENLSFILIFRIKEENPKIFNSTKISETICGELNIKDVKALISSLANEIIYLTEKIGTKKIDESKEKK